MRKLLSLGLVILLAACQEEEAEAPPPQAMTAQTIGYFCQMNVVEHGGPKGQIALEGFPGGAVFFSQVSDTVAYLRMPEQNYRILATYVTDMGTAPSWDEPGKAAWIPIDTAVFVVGSDRMGGMDQPEYIPFGDPQKAADFAAAHGGKVMALADIPAAEGGGPVVNPGDDNDFLTRLRNQTQKGGE